MTPPSTSPLRCIACRQPAPPGTLPGARCPADEGLFVDALDAEQRPDDPWLGQTVGGKYALFGIIGVGGFGAVYRAVQAPVGRTVAVKVIRPQLNPDSQSVLRARFFREAKVVARLADPAIVTLYDYGEDPDGRLYMVFEYIDGTPLSSVLRAGPLAAERVAPLLHQILGALALAHRLGCVHRDLKPGNVMLTRSPFGEDLAKVLDFGIAKVNVSTETEHSLQSSLETREGVVVGTPKYMAPEQARAGEIDGRADLYALGCLGYAMLTGRPPFDDVSAVDVLMAQVSRPVPPFPEHLGVPAPLAGVIYRALSKSPADRFATAEDMAHAIAAFTPGLATTQEHAHAPRTTSLGEPGPSATLVVSSGLPAPPAEGGTSREFVAAVEPPPASPTTPIPAAASTVPPSDGRRGFLWAVAIGLVVTVGFVTLRPSPSSTPPPPPAPTTNQPPAAAMPAVTISPERPEPLSRALAAAARNDDSAAAAALLEALTLADRLGPDATSALVERIEREPSLARVRNRPEVASRLGATTPMDAVPPPSAPPSAARDTPPPPVDRPSSRGPRPAGASGSDPRPSAPASSPAAASRLAVPEF